MYAYVSGQDVHTINNLKSEVKRFLYTNNIGTLYINHSGNCKSTLSLF